MSSRTSTIEVGLEPKAAQPPNHHGHIPKPASRTEEKEDGSCNTRGTLHQLKYHAYTFWLFTVSDVPTTLIQTVLFGVAGASSGRLTTPPSSATAPPPSLAVRLLLVFLYTWLLLIVFQVGNQSTPGAPAEDRLNKPWRPIPAGRITRARAHGLVGPGLFLVLAAGFALGVFPEAALFAAATYAYTDLGGSEALTPRQAANGLLIASAGQAALKVAAWPAALTAAGHAWSGAHFGLAATTIQTMDFRDQAGDAAIGRQTLPLVMGDAPARWVTGMSVLFWTGLCPWLCDSGAWGYTLSAATGSVLVFNLLVYRTVSADRRAYKLWGVWLAAIYSLPWLSLLP